LIFDAPAAKLRSTSPQAISAMNTLRTWLKELDRLLRGETARAVVAERNTSPLDLGACVGAAIALGVVYGLFMGLFAVLTRTPPCWPQLIATALKVPALFLFTLVVTLPSLYVFSALLGSPLRFAEVVRVLAGAIAINLCVLAAFGPITGFFTISTTSYIFIKLLNVAFFTIAGLLGLGFLVWLFRLLEDSRDAEASPPVADSPPAPPLLPATAAIRPTGDRPSSLAPRPTRLNKVLAVWLVLYGLVGAQMGWVLRPFIGDPQQAFTWFRAREANFFLDLLRSLGELVR
jgi:hypothetical protein